MRAVDLPECRIPELELSDFNGSASEVARAVRAMLNLPSGPVSNIVKVIEDAGGLIVPCVFGSYDVDAISRWVPDCRRCSSSTQRRPLTFRMNLAHELGHLVMHRAPEPDMEHQANAFAAEFLMPQWDMRPDLYSITLARLAALKPHWRVSMTALLKRASDLDCIHPNASRYLWMRVVEARVP